jgi:hypothetical protein
VPPVVAGWVIVAVAISFHVDTALTPVSAITTGCCEGVGVTLSSSPPQAASAIASVDTAIAAAQGSQNVAVVTVSCLFTGVRIESS